MVATIQVLKGSTSFVAAYFDLLDGDPTTRYYATEHTGVWHGLAAKALGLTGEVTGSDFENLLAGKTPDGKTLVSRRKRTKTKRQKQQREERVKKNGGDPKTEENKKRKPPPRPVIGLDVTMSVPKSVSLLHAIAPPAIKKEIELALQAAATQTLDQLESMAPLGRRSKAGHHVVHTKLAVSTFMHTLNRDNEPQLHVHCVVANACLGTDGRWASINSRLLHQWTPALGRIFRCYLARELIQRLGVRLCRPERNGKQQSWFEIEGISRKVIDAFSSRRKAILRSLTPDQQKDGKQRKQAALDTRKQKDRDPDMGKLQDEWRAKAKSLGLDKDRVADLCNRPSKSEPLPEFQQTFRKCIQELGREKSHFHEADLVSAVCEVYQHHGVDPNKLVDRIRDEMKSSPELVALREQPANTRLASRETWEIEQKLLRDVEALDKTDGVKISARVLVKTLRKHSHLDDEQKNALTHVVTSKGSIRVMTGVAGAGKSTTIDAIRDAFERSGHRVLGTAIAGKAANELADRGGIETRTVASYLYHLERSKAGRVADRVRHDVRMLTRALTKKKTWRHQPVKISKKSVLIVDEAGMLDTRTLSRLLHHCEKHKATVVLTGDSHQLPPILAGGPLDHLVDKTGDAKLTQNRRQQDPADREAVKKFRDGEIEEAIKDYADRDRLKVGRDTEQAKKQLVQSWCENKGHKRPAKHLILTQTREDAHDINHRCQQERLKRMRVIPGLSIKHGNSRFYMGDRVSFHQPMRKHGIENGHGGTVIAVDPITRNVTVRLDREPSKKQKKMGIKQIQRISLLGLDKDAVRLGYASTTHRAQGTTTEKSYVLMAGPMMSREIIYTQLTRAREATRLFVDSSTAGKGLQKLIQAISRSGRKDLAHDHKTDSELKKDDQPSKKQKRGMRSDSVSKSRRRKSRGQTLEIDRGIQ